MDDITVGIIIAIIVISAVTLIAIALRGRQRIRELTIQERIAMIERGLVPPPEVDPDRFDRALLLAYAVKRASNPKSGRYRTMGVMLMGLGAALFLLLAFAAGVPQTALGVAGGVFVLGIAAYINGSLIARDVPGHMAAAPRTQDAPPDNVAP